MVADRLVVERGEIEPAAAARDAHHPERRPLAERGEVGERLGIIAVVVDDQDIVVPIGRRRQGFDAAPEQLQLVPRRDDDGDVRAVVGKYQRQRRDAALDGPGRVDHADVRPAAALQRILDDASRGIEACGLCREPGRRRTGRRPPVVEKIFGTWPTWRARSAMRRARSWSCDPSNADLRPPTSMTSGAPGADDVAEIHVGEKEGRRPVRLELRGVTPAIRVDLVVVAVDEVRVGVVRVVEGEFGEAVGRDQVVVVEEGDDLTARQRQRGVGRSADPAVSLEPPDPESVDRAPRRPRASARHAAPGCRHRRGRVPSRYGPGPGRTRPSPRRATGRCRRPA